eukprot:scaffold275285_cov28-Tisochrysis_lutea.AAC.3
MAEAPRCARGHEWLRSWCASSQVPSVARQTIGGWGRVTSPSPGVTGHQDDGSEVTTTLDGNRGEEGATS